MTARELHIQLQSPSPPRLIQVLPPEIHAATRVPGAINACVYETSFLDQVRQFVPDAATPVVVYGAGGGSLDAVTAAEKLQEAGYTKVRAFEGGLDAWKAEGLPFEGHGHLPQPPVPDGTFRVDTETSVIRWTGRNLFNHHSGTVLLSGGEILLSRGELVSGRFTVDMSSIACEDLADSVLNAMLIAHLHTTDFFDVANHPTAEFVAQSVQKIENSSEGTSNYRLRGSFMLRGITRSVDFPVVIAVTEDGKRLTAQGQLDLDRTEFGSRYGSGKLFRFLGKHVVNDHVQLHVKVSANLSE